ncbi:hypothetical protein Zm00014a_028181 [Zea mays]|uniref:Uncharacterized protein n=1 Tax=Zea mays TaxID=4577 RepID=A0A3L6DDK5_MAIZE|nr:hypothetical protein Zm00014a_028181 [Zea mays]
MGDFLGEMADMMSQATPTVTPAPAGQDLERPSRVEIRALTQSSPSVNVQESFEELQQLFVDMFQDDLDGAGFFGGLPTSRSAQGPSSTSLPPSTSPLRPTPPARSKGAQTPSSFNGAGRRGSTAKRPRTGWAGLEPDLGLSGFCFMVSKSKERPAAWACDGGDERSGSKQRLSTSRLRLRWWDVALAAEPNQ